VKISILGGGNMGRALAGGLLRRNTRPEHISIGEAVPAARESLAKELGLSASADNASVVANASVVVVAVKPQDVGSVLAPLAPLIRASQAIVVSIAAGIRTSSLQAWLGERVPVVRAMPNRPALVGAGATGLYAGATVNAAHRAEAESVMKAVGEVVWVQTEEALDVVTALSGSGPAYFFLLAEAMADAAVGLGLERDAARRLAVATLHGSGLLAHTGDGDLARMRQEVTSKGGTTEAALRILELADFRKTVATAVEAATRRGAELAVQFGGPAA
jgi:pyrroline-5-carboxylate reductase